MFTPCGADDEVAAAQVTRGKNRVANYETKTPPPLPLLSPEDKVDKETLPQRSPEALKTRPRQRAATGEPITKNTSVRHDINKNK